MAQREVILSRKEIKALQVLKKALPIIGKFNTTDWPPVMAELRAKARIEDEQMADRVIGSLEAHGLINCSRYEPQVYSPQTLPPKMMLKGFVTAEGAQFLRRGNPFLSTLISVIVYAGVGALVLSFMSILTGAADPVSGLLLGGLAGLVIKVAASVETLIRSRLIVD